MRPTYGLAHVFLGCALLATSCAKLDFWRRAESPAIMTEGPRVGTIAPDIEGEDFEGKHFKLSDYRGKVVVVSFWSSGCRPCRDLIPYERTLVERHRDKPFVMLGVDLDENPELGRKVIDSHGISWRCWQACSCERSTINSWNVSAIPALFVIDAKGVIRVTNAHGPTLDRAIDALIAETEKKRAG